MEYSFLSQEKFYQIVEEHLKTLSKPDKNVITKQVAQQIIHIIEGNFVDSSADHNMIRWVRNFIVRNIKGNKYLYKRISKKHQQVDVRVCTKEEMYLIFCRLHNGDLGEGHRGQNATWKSLSQQYCCFPQSVCEAACKACSVCCTTKSIQKAPQGKPIIAKEFLQRLQVILISGTQLCKLFIVYALVFIVDRSH